MPLLLKRSPNDVASRSCDYGCHADGQTCRRQTVGLLGRRAVHAGAVHLVGKESNRLEDVQDGLVQDETDAVTECHPIGPPARTVICAGCQQPFQAVSLRACACSKPCEKQV